MNEALAHWGWGGACRAKNKTKKLTLQDQLVCNSAHYFTAYSNALGVTSLDGPVYVRSISLATWPRALAAQGQYHLRNYGLSLIHGSSFSRLPYLTGLSDHAAASNELRINE